MAPIDTQATLPRRTLLKAGLALIAAPLPIRARAETPVKIGMVEPLTGVYAGLADSEVAGAKFAVERVNQDGGILGRQVELLVADCANDIAAGVHKTRELIERDQVDFITGNVNSAAMLTKSPAAAAAGMCSASARRRAWRPTRSPTP
jgi:branched-chain amino acid transport system substrate-binding protein